MATVASEVKSFQAACYQCGGIRSFTTLGGTLQESVETGDVKDRTFHAASIRWTGSEALTRAVLGDAESAGVEYCADLEDFAGGRQRRCREGVVGDGTEGGYQVVVDGLQNGTPYYYRAYVLTGDGYTYGNIRALRTKGGDDLDLTEEWTDLGLSCLWANQNVGAATPEEPGLSLIWGGFNQNSAAGTAGILKHIDMYGSICGSTQYDAAQFYMGTPWRLPYRSELEELQAKCTWEEGSRQGKKGYMVIGKNEKAIFLPYVAVNFDIRQVIYNDTIIHSGTVTYYKDHELLLWSGDCVHYPVEGGRIYAPYALSGPSHIVNVFGLTYTAAYIRAVRPRE
ncbi:MAG: hypothetical protein ILA34_04230 [Bacteroidaceae bacterium]|nr:hypothetical protein [Bacteroidaceae bacterium]